MRAVSLLTGHENLLDHLGVLSICLDLPLIVSEEKTYQLAKKFYPQLNVSLKPLHELTLEYFAAHYDWIFETGKFFAIELAPFLELLFKKKMRFIYCPHGNSDKGHSLNFHVDQDIGLFYGDHLFDLLKQTGATKKIQHLVRTGNYRYQYYLQQAAFYDEIVNVEVFKAFKVKKPIILYAPTWHNKENPTSFFDAIDPVIEQLSSSFNLLIKLHPLLIDQYPAHIYASMCRYEDYQTVQFLFDFPPIYPLLSQCAIYLGDTSSIGYDFLAFDQPLYFLRAPERDSNSCLYKTGLSIRLDQLNCIGSFIESTWEESKEKFKKKREEVYNYAFGAPRSMQALKEDIFCS